MIKKSVSASVVFVFCFLAVMLIVLPSFAYPTSVNDVPTADVVDEGWVEFEIGDAGHTALMCGDSVSCLSMQLGVAPGFEVGVDAYSESEDANTIWNAKLQVVSETGRTPAIALGLMDIAGESRRSSYVAFSKTLGYMRGHIGFAEGEHSRGIMLGAEADISDRLWFGADYIRGAEGYARLGCTYLLAPSVGVTLTYGMPNNKRVSESEFSVALEWALDLARASR